MDGKIDHVQNLRELFISMNETILAKLDGLRAIMDERDHRYTERDHANKEAVNQAFQAAEKASDKTESALVEYKKSANEWRDTVKDLIAGLREARSERVGKTLGSSALWGYIIGAVGLMVMIYNALK